MGNNSFSNEFKSGKWRKVETVAGREILQNIETQMQVERHFALSDFSSFEDRFKNTEIYNWRKALDPSVNLVKLYEFEIKEERFGIQEEQYVYTEKIVRFNQKGRIFSKPEGFLLLLDFLTGLEILFQNFGLFKVDLFLLGTCQNGRGKVWLNENLARNKVEAKNVIQSPNQNSELVVVNNLMRIVKDRVYNQDFMPEVEFPYNMRVKQAIQYLTAVRREHILFRVDKAYQDRSLFKQHYNMLYKQYFSGKDQNLSVQPSLLNPSQLVHQPQFLPVHSSQRPFLKQKSVSLIKVTTEPGQTMSSDSNSRSKRPVDKILDEQTYIVKKHEQNYKAPSTQFADPRQQLFSPNLQPNLQPHIPHFQQVPIQIPNFVRDQRIIHQNHHNILHPQNKMIPGGIQNSAPIYKFEQPRMINEHQVMHNLPVNFPRTQILDEHQFFQPFKSQPLMQRRVVEYRPVNQHILNQGFNVGQNLHIVRNQSFQHQLGPMLNLAPQSPNNFYSQNLGRQGQYIKKQGLIPGRQDSRQNTSKSFQNHPINSNFQGPGIIGTRQVEEKFIDNVELCESEIFDRAELDQNLADLEA